MACSDGIIYKAVEYAKKRSFSRYSFAWREYVANHADEFLKIID